MIHAPTQRTQRPAHGVNTPSGHIHPPKRYTPAYGPGGVLPNLVPNPLTIDVTAEASQFAAAMERIGLTAWQASESLHAFVSAHDAAARYAR